MRSNEEIVDILVNRMEQMNMSMSELARRVGTLKGSVICECKKNKQDY